MRTNGARLRLVAGREQQPNRELAESGEQLTATGIPEESLLALKTGSDSDELVRQGDRGRALPAPE
jgi:hypothetical protein